MEEPLNRRLAAHTLYMSEMLARLGFSLEDLESRADTRTTEKAKDRCRSCGAAKACAKWLEGRESGTIPISEVPFFCPNRELLASLCERKPE